MVDLSGSPALSTRGLRGFPPRFGAIECPLTAGERSGLRQRSSPMRFVAVDVVGGWTPVVGVAICVQIGPRLTASLTTNDQASLHGSYWARQHPAQTFAGRAVESVAVDKCGQARCILCWVVALSHSHEPVHRVPEFPLPRRGPGVVPVNDHPSVRTHDKVPRGEVVVAYEILTIRRQRNVPTSPPPRWLVGVSQVV